MPIRIELGKAEAIKVIAALQNEPWAAGIRSAIERGLAAEPPWRKVVATSETHSSGYGALNYRADKLECGHEWTSSYTRWPNSPPDTARRRRCKQCAQDDAN